ncbi:MAG TPA: phosphoglycerate kinase [Dehalococcoidia bacterium]|nr:phosphoglycerate kinase [Dehalococcoidia bacterium]
MEKKTVRDIEIKDKRVLVRVDFNVPLGKSTGKITDDSRIRGAIPTIQYLIDQGAKAILCSHLGRPKGQVSEELRLSLVGERLSQLLGKPVKCTPDCIGTVVERPVSEMKSGDVLLLENLRFHPEEEKNDPEFARSLALLADVFVNDAFGTAHRAHASTVGIAGYLPAVAGFLMEKELEFMGKAMADPARPFAMLVGGAKVSDKIGLLENILEKVNSLIIGGGMAHTFLKAQGYDVGNSPVEDDRLEFAWGLIEKAARRGVHLLLPTDAVVARELSAESAYKTVSLTDVPEDWMILDIGPESVKSFGDELKGCKTIIWNGPMGVFEFAAFRHGTSAIAKLLVKLDATTIIGGGSTAEAIAELGLTDKMTHVSTGGGASLRFLEGKPLPGVAALLDKDEMSVQ